MKVFHILNGDSLKSQFPIEEIPGELIVARECLVDGDVSGSSLKSLIDSRKKALNEMFGTSSEEYEEKVVPELKKIDALAEGEINLWFEDDLFCQVNFWFVCSLLLEKSIKVFLIRPSRSLQYGFAGYTPQQLPELYKNRIKLSEEHLSQFGKLWTAYQTKDTNSLQTVSSTLLKDFPFLEEVIKAQLDRLPLGNGLPEKTLKDILTELDTQDFGPIFKAFSQRLPIYGFGDLQVKRLLDQIQKK